MMINKNRFRISNDKKVLHKIGKRWVTVSALTLALLGGAAAASTVTTHAATTTPAVEAQHTDNVKKQINSNLNSAANSNNAKSTAASAQSSSATKPSAVQSSAANMHNALLQNAANQKLSVKSAGSSVASNAPIHQSAQPNSAYEAYLKQNPQLAKLYNKTANQSSSNVVSGLVNKKNNKPLMKLVSSSPRATNTHTWGTAKWTLNNSDLYLSDGGINQPRTGNLGAQGGLNWNNVHHIYTHNVSAFGLGSTFANMPQLQTIDLSGFDFGHVDTMFQMFYNDPNLTDITFGHNVDVSHVQDMTSVFQNDYSLKHIYGLGNWSSTRNVKSYIDMFWADNELSDLDLSSFDTRLAYNNENTNGTQNGLNQMMGLGGLTHLTLGPNTYLYNPNNTRNEKYNAPGGSYVKAGTYPLVSSTFGDGQAHPGEWIRNAEIIHFTLNNNDVDDVLLNAPVNASMTFNTAPITAPSKYHVLNPNQQITISGGITNVPVELASDYNTSVANSIANSAEAIAENSANGTISADSKALNSDIHKINSLTNNNTSLSNEVSYANSVAQSDVSAVNSWKASSQAIATSLASASGSNNTNSSAISSLETASTTASQALDRANASLASDATSIGSLKNALASVSSSASNGSAQATSNSGWIHSNSGSLSNASTEASEASASAKTNAGKINGINNELSNYNTVNADAVNAMNSLNADKDELSWLASSEYALSTGSSQASSNANWIANNSASVSALSQNFHDVYNKIQQDSTALNQAIGSKADTSDLTNKYNALSGDITNASSLASDADKLAKGNAGEISNLKANTAITFTFTQDGSNVLIPVTMTNGYIEANAQSHNGNTYNITNLLDNAVASKGKHAVGTYTVTLGDDKNGDATLNFKAQPQNTTQKKFGVGMAAPSANGMTTFKLGTPVQQRKAWNFVQYGLNNHKGLILGATSQVPSSNDTAHNVVLANNQAEYKGDIILNFGSHQTKVPFDTGSTNSKVLASDTVNLLNYAKNAQNPSDFTKDNLINGFDTTGFKFDGATSTPNHQYNFTIQPSDATNQTGADIHRNYNITLNYTAQPVTENIQYVYGSHIENVNKTTTTAKGNDDSQGSWNSTNNLKPGWTLATTDNKFTFTNNGTAEINVAPVQTSDTINYVDQKGNQVGSQTFIGNNYQATDAGNNDIKLSNLESVVPSGYKLQNANIDKAIGFDGGTHTVNVIGNARSPKNTVPSSTKPSDANNPKSNKSMTKPTGDSDVLFTINVQDYNADGTKEINHYTKYTTESGEVGDPFTIKASDYLTNGFVINTKKSADNNVSGTIGDSHLQPNSVTFNYYAKPYDPNAYNQNPNDPTLPKPITVQYIGELNGKANQVVKTYNNAITGDTGDTGTLSNIESKAPVPQGYNVNGSSYNYTITTDPQTIKVNLNSKTAKQMNNGGQNYKPATPSDKPSSKVPSDNTVKKDAKHGFATVIINENVDGKLAHQSAQTVDESNLGVGDSYTIEPTSFTPKGYQVDSNDKALTGTVNPDGSLSNGSATFTYDVNDSEIAPITVTYYNQYGDLIDVNTGKSKLTGENVSSSQATQTVQSAQLATKGAIGDYVDITGFLTAPKGHHFDKDIIDSSSNDLDHVQLQQAKDNLPVHLGLTLFEAMPKPQPKPTPKPKSNSNSASTITPASASAEIQSAASSAAQSASVSASASAASAEQSAVNSAANSAAQNNGSAVTSTEQSMAKADASNEAHDDAVASAARSAAGSAEASAAVSAADEVRSAEANHNDSKAIANVKARAASAERSAARSAAQSAKASATDSVEDSIASSEDDQEAHASQNAEPSHEANVQREAASHMVGVSNKLAQPSTTVHASRIGSNDQNANGHKLPQTNENKAAGLMGAASIMAALGLAGADTDRKRRRE